MMCEKDADGLNLLERRLMEAAGFRMKAGLRNWKPSCFSRKVASDYLEITEILHLLCPPNHAREHADTILSFISSCVCTCMYGI